MLILVQPQFDCQSYSRQYHLQESDCITVELFQEIAAEFAAFYRQRKLLDRQRLLHINFFFLNVVEWKHLFSIKIDENGACILDEKTDYPKILGEAIQKTKGNTRYQKAVSWLKENNWTDLQYHNWQYWAVPPDGYMPVCIPCPSLNKHWETIVSEQCTEHLGSEVTFYLKTALIPMGAITAVFIIISLAPHPLLTMLLSLVAWMIKILPIIGFIFILICLNDNDF